MSGRPDVPPLVVVGQRRNAFRLIALDERASAAGLVRGQALTDARAMYPRIDVAQEDEAADRALLEAIADWCDRYTPLVSVDAGSDSHACGLMLDITGCAHLFGGEKALIGDLLSRLFHQGFAAGGAVAPTPGGAWALARHHPAGAAGGLQIVRKPELCETLATLPLQALRLETDIVSGLARLGLRNIGQLASRPRAPLARRFGRQVLLRLDQALGEVEEAISPRLPVPETMAERRLAEPVIQTEAIEILTERLAGHLCQEMERRGQGARRLELALFRVDGDVIRLDVGTSRPVREASVIVRLFRERLAALEEMIDAGFGFDMVRLCVLRTETMPEETRQMLAEHGGSRQVSDLVDRLGARLGSDRVLRAVARETHLPEQAEQLLPACSVPTFSGRPKDEGASSLPAGAMPVGLPVLRPLRLFIRPERIEAVAQVPDGPPLRFRWRRVLREVLAAEGPERIADEWWRNGQNRPTRDYFRVEDREGRRYWLFREGLYGSETNNPDWFLHGLFA